MHVLEELCYELEDLLEPIVKKGDMTPTELDNVKDALESIYYIETIKAMKEYGNSNAYSYAMGNSNRGSYRYDGRSYDSYRSSYDGRMGMDGDGDGRYSERRGRNSNGRYSRGDEREDMMARLGRM